MSWQQLIKAVKAAYWKAKWAVRDAAGALVCIAKGGCHYDTPEFHSQCLYFCTRCNKELTGRTFDDIEPLSDEDHEWLLRMEDIRRETCP